MKICYLVNSCHEHAVRWVCHFRDAGHEIHVITAEPVSLPGVHVHIIRTGVSPDKHSSGNYPRSWLLATALPQVLYLVRKKIRPHILHSQLATSFGFIGSLTGWHPHILSVLGSDVLLLHKRSPVFTWIARYALRRADLVLATGRFLAEETKKVIPGLNVTVTPFGIDLAKFSPAACPDKTGETAPLVGCVKNLRRLSGIDYLLKAVPLVLDKCPKTKFLIVGSPHGAGEKEIERELKESVRLSGLEDHIRFQPAVPHSEMPRLLGSLRVLALPSLSEAFGVVALEAQAMEVPVVSFAVGGLNETVGHRRSGFLVEKGSWEDLGDRITELLLDDKLHARMSREGRAFVEERYNWVENAKIMENLYSVMARS